MSHHNYFVIRNEMSECLTLNVEPEGVFVPLPQGDEVIVIDDFKSAPVTLKFCGSSREGPIVSIWPGDGDVRVEKGGVNVLDLTQNVNGTDGDSSARTSKRKSVPRA
jgi:hypothetical protein